jgi:thiamine pyrophosphate-dependent acetolactate synthase large subunit-like protein
MGSLFNASFTGTPMILTAGQQEQGHGLMEPVLYGPLVQMAEPLVKWAVEVTRLEDLPRIVRRAAKIATTPPTGPVFISLPGDILNAEAGIELGRSTRVDTAFARRRGAAGARRAYPKSRAAGDRHRRRDRQERRAEGSAALAEARVRQPTNARRPMGAIPL